MCDILKRLASPGLSKQQYLSNLNEFSRLCRAKKKEELLEIVGDQFQQTDSETSLIDDVFRCLKVALFHDAAEVRAACLRAIRYLMRDETSVRSLLRVDLPVYIVRSIDIVLENRTERIQALRLVRKFLSIAPHLFPSAFTRSLIAIAQDGQMEHDSLTRACWALLAELSIMSPISSTKDTQNCAFNAIMDAALSGNQPHGMCESLISTLLFMLNWPKYRRLIRGDLDLQIFVAPFTDSHYTASVSKDQKQKINQTAKFDVDPYDQRENKFTAAKISLISILRSWQGLIYLCEPQSSECNLVSNSCLKSLINMLYLPYSDVRRRLIDLIFELLYLPLPESTPDFEAGLKFLERHQLSKDSWKIHDAFVVDEAKALLPPLRSRSRMNMVSDYMALLLVALFHCNVVDALSEVIITPSNQENSIRATLLLYQLLSLSYQYLPTDSFSQYLTLSTLISHAASKVDDSRDLANAALSNLGRDNPFKKSSNQSNTRCSIFLSQILEFCSQPQQNQSSQSSNETPTKNQQNNHSNMSTTSTINSISTITSQNLGNESSSSSTSTLVNTHKRPSRSPSISSKSPSILSKSPSISEAVAMFTNFSFKPNSKSILKTIIEQDWQSWDWEHINFILTRPCDEMKKMSSQHYRSFLKKLVNFFKPSFDQYSSIDINNERCRQLCKTGCNLVDFLSESSEPKAAEYLEDLLDDISMSMHCDSDSHNNYTTTGTMNSDAISNNASTTGTPLGPLMPHSDINILSSSKLISTMSSTYFLFIGRLSSSSKGYQMLEKSSIMKLIDNLTRTSMLATSPAEVYVRLIISSFDYSKEFNGSRKILEKFLFHHPEENVRIFATNFIRVLLRTSVPDFANWAIELLVRLLDSPIRIVHHTAADILDEACDLDENLEGLVALRQVLNSKNESTPVLEILRSAGDAGILLLSRFASSPNGLRYLIETPRQRLSCPLDSVLGGRQDLQSLASPVVNNNSTKSPTRKESMIKIESEFDSELNRWQRVFNYRYVKLVEDVLNNSLTYHQKGEDGKYGRRIDRVNPMTKNSYLPPHLYGQLALHPDSIEIMQSRNLLKPIYEIIKNPPTDLDCSEVSLLKMKAALWIIGHVGSSESGYQTLDNSRELIRLITGIARDANVLSLRGTAFYVLGLLGSTEEGAEEMKEHGWIVQQDSQVALPLDLNLILAKPHDDNDPVDESEPESISENDASKVEPHPILMENYSLAELQAIRRDILKFVTNLSGSVASRPAENSLLNLKRKFGIVFQYDIDLYSEVCHQLAKYNFRLHARRFLQELFLDITR